MPLLRRVPKTFLKVFLALAAVVVLVLIVGFAYLDITHDQMVSLPEPTGPYAVGRISYDWVDTSRPEIFTRKRSDKRELMVWAWYPAKHMSRAGSASYLPGKWGKEREKRIGVFSFLLRNPGSVRTHSFADAPISDARSRYPVLIMEPGFGTLPTDYTTLAEDLASRGYVVFASAPTYSASVVVFKNGRVAKQLPRASFPERSDNAPATRASVRADEAAGNRLIKVWSQDVIFEMNKLQELNGDPKSVVHGRLDLREIGVFGHSFGGATALQVCHLNSRCKAAVDLDGTPYGSVVRSDFGQPFMYFASQQTGPCDRECKLSDEQIRRIYDHSKGASYYLTIRGARHFNFSDYAAISTPFEGWFLKTRGLLGPIGGRRGLRITGDYLGVFFGRYLKSEREPLLNGPSPKFTEVRFESR